MFFFHRAVPSSPINLNAEAVEGDPSSLYVTWVPPAVPNGVITRYGVYCQESQPMMGSGSGGSFLSPVFTGGSELNATVTGLIPFTIYGCFVSANTSVGEGNASATVFQTTDEFSKFGNDTLKGPVTSFLVSVL